jgi:single-stranded-DNA-specific exonuclease
MQTEWNILQPDQELVRHIQQNLNCHPITATVLANRGIGSSEAATEFLQASMAGLPSPMLLDDMPTAVERIVRAIDTEEKILVIGDYDADGVTATAVLVDFLQTAGANVTFHLPHRIHEGYGFHASHVMQLAVPQGIALIITVDCGSASHEAVAAAGRFGIDVIVTDHHNISVPMPDALAIINPKKPGQSPELVDLAGVGVAFYLTIALRAALREKGWWRTRPEPNLKSYCDLVALGTIADIVPLIGVNRILTKAGLEQMNNGQRPGIQALREAAGIARSTVTSDDIAFRIAPRINAAGRVSHARVAFDLLCAENLESALKAAETLNSLNNRRQAIEGQIYEEILARIESRPDLLQRRTLLLAGGDWHEGVLGIVAAKLASQYNRPVVLVSTRDGIGKGSGRSIPQVDLFRALQQCPGLMDRFGGHHQAAGLTVVEEKIDHLRKAFEAAVAGMMPTDSVSPGLTIDSTLSFDQITPQLMDELQWLEPHGAENQSPLFMAREVRVITAAIFGQRHRRMKLHQGHNQRQPIGAIHFNLSPTTPRPNFFDRLAFRLQWNRYRGAREMQIVVEGF